MEYQAMGLVRARWKHPDPITTIHQGYALIKEELDELWDEVKAKNEYRSKERMLSELLDIAVVCQRIAEDLKLEEYL